MNRKELVEHLSHGDASLKLELEGIDDECLQVISGNFSEVKEKCPNTQLESFTVVEKKSLIIKFTVTVNTLPYVIKPFTNT